MCTTCGCQHGNLYIEGDEHNPHSPFGAAPFAAAPRAVAPISTINLNTFTPDETPDGSLNYGHGEAGTHAPGLSQRKMVEIEINVLDKNNQIAQRNRQRLARAASWR